jgi:hypothetical protein
VVSLDGTDGEIRVTDLTDNTSSFRAYRGGIDGEPIFAR